MSLKVAGASLTSIQWYSNSPGEVVFVGVCLGATATVEVARGVGLSGAKVEGDITDGIEVISALVSTWHPATNSSGDNNSHGR
jgi:hypothetical protein